MEAEIIKISEKSNIQDRLANIGTQWHFIPPSAPHFGGIWESGVKSMKNHFKRIVGEATLTYEELTTLMHEIEACLNSRPLYQLTDEINDLSVLTPGHFLVGRELLTPANPIEVADSMQLTGRWKLIQKMKKDFWKIWSSEYLHEMQQRNKWKLETDNLKVGDVVLVKKDNLSPSKWPLARIKKVHEDEEGLVRVVTLIKAIGTETKRPIHKLVPLPTEADRKDENLQENIRRSKGGAERWKGNWWRIVAIAIIFMLQMKKTQAGAQYYHIEKPHPGFYIEHLGRAKIDRGSFRVELKIDEQNLDLTLESVNNTIRKISDLCGKMQELSTDIESKSLIDHLREEQNRIEWMKTGIKTTVLKRQKRGLWGTFLTSIFGVNDEVYRDIEDLDKNQKELIHASHQQTKFMLQAIAQFNETEVRMNRKLNDFTEKLKRGLTAVEEMQRWYRSIDKNSLEIHILGVYEVAKTYLDEILHLYKSVLNIKASKENLYELISPAYIEKIVTEASNRLPTNIEILSHPIVKTELEQKDNMTYVFGYFAISEVTGFDLMKANPVPFNIENGMYQTLEVGNEIIAIDYNNQRYFQLSHRELRSSTTVEKHVYICSPSIIRSIENNQNCLIDEIYQRVENTSCPVSQHKIQNMIWKKLYTPNTCMFIVERKTKIAIICSGEREETYIQQTGIIAISQNCIITTKRSILTPKRLQTLPVVAGYSKPVAVNLTMSKRTYPGAVMDEEAELEPYDDIQSLKKSEEHSRSNYMKLTGEKYLITLPL